MTFPWLVPLISDHENWLIKRIIQYAKDLGYTQYTSTLEEAWRISIGGLSQSIIKGIELHKDIPRLGPDDSCNDNPLTYFGRIEAQRHRKRGISLSMFLGLMKYYRQTYIDLLQEKAPEQERDTGQLFVNRCFDQIEISFCQEWVNTTQNVRINELQNTNRIMTNEKNAYLTVFESLHEPAILVDGSYHIINLNHAAALLINSDVLPGSNYYQTTFSQEQWDLISDRQRKEPITGQPLKKLFPWLSDFLPDDIKTNWQAFKNSQTQIRTPIHGQDRIFDIRCSNLLDISERYSSFVVTMRDITAQKNAEELVETRENTLNSIFRAAPVGIGLVSNRILTQVNDRMCEICGYAPEELINQSARMLYPTQEEFEWVGQEKYRQISENGTGTVETRWRHKNGHIIDILLSSTPLDPDNLPKGVTFAALDITDRKQAMRELQSTMEALSATNRELDHFAYTISHDLKNPLITIKGMIEWIKRGIESNKFDTIQEDFKFIQRACDQMECLLNGVLQLSRLGRTLGETVEVDMSPIVHEAIETCQGLIQQKGVSLTIDDDFGKVTCDPLRIRPVWENLISNAIKFMGDQSHPSIKLGVHSGPQPTYYIRDNGIGIDPEYIDKIFESFSRLNSDIEGSGLGLALVKRIINAHHGKIWAESPGINQGSVFYFTLGEVSE